jgi:hypothetical protein
MMYGYKFEEDVTVLGKYYAALQCSISSKRMFCPVEFTVFARSLRNSTSYLAFFTIL